MKRMLTNRFSAVGAGTGWCMLVAWLSIVTAAAPADDAVLSCQPDLKIAPAGGDYSGEDVYSATGLGQTIERRGSRRSVVQYWIAVQNDGGVRDCFQLRGNPNVSHSKWIQRYYDALEGGNEITGLVRGSGWKTAVLPPGQEQIIRLYVVPGAEVDRLDIALTASSSLTTGDLNITPSSGADLRFEMETPSGLIDIQTLHDNQAGYTYEGPASVIRIAAKAQGRTLQHLGHALALSDGVRYTITSDNTVVNLRNRQPGSKGWNQAKGHWWLELTATSAALDPTPGGCETPKLDTFSIITTKGSGSGGGGARLRVREWKEK